MAISLGLEPSLVQSLRQSLSIHAPTAISVYIYIYIYVCVYMYVCMYVCMYVFCRLLPTTGSYIYKYSTVGSKVFSVGVHGPFGKYVRPRERKKKSV